MAKKRKILSPAKTGKISIKVAKAAVKQVMETKKAKMSKVKELVDCETTEEQVGWILRTIEKLYIDDYNVEKRLNKRIDRLVEAIDKCKRVKGI